MCSISVLPPNKAVEVILLNYWLVYNLSDEAFHVFSSDKMSVFTLLLNHRKKKKNHKMSACLWFASYNEQVTAAMELAVGASSWEDLYNQC